MISTPTKLDLPILRISYWPVKDGAAWEAATTSVGWFDDNDRLARYSSTKIRVFESAYGRWLGFLSVHDPEAFLDSGLDHLGADQVSALYEQLYAVLAPCTVRAYLTDLLTVVRAMAPGRSFSHLQEAVRHIWRIAEPQNDNHHRIVPARDLFSLGLKLMQNAPARSTLLKQAGLYRDGLMIAMLIARPVRRGNFASIEIDLHIQKLHHDYWLVFSAAQVKNRRPMEYRLPPQLYQPIECYLDQYRPYLLSRRGRHWRDHPGNAFWISDHGAPLKGAQIRERINRHTNERFDFTVNPHRFRKCAATSIAIEDPEHVGIILPVLGHARATTGEQYYNQARSLHAARRFQAAIESFRNEPGDLS
jgi:integrase/recombinase XerD